MIGASVASLAIGDVLYAFRAEGPAEAFYYGMFVLVATALLQFTRFGSLLSDRARLIDLLAASCTTLLVIWVFLIGGHGQIGKISAADVIGDLLLIAVAVRLVLAAGRNVSAALLLAGSIGVLASDIFWSLSHGPVTEIGYVVLYVTWGLAALHPSMKGLTEPMPPNPTPWRGHWAALLGVSVATPPTVLLVEALNGAVVDGVVIAVVGAITLLLTITRLADSIAQNSRAAEREHALRTASGALVAAADQPAVEEAVHAAVAQLMPATAVREMLFATDDRRLAESALPTEPIGSKSRPRSWLAGSDGDYGTLVCPLWLEPMAVARPSGGALIVTARRDVLAATRDALEVLAGQAAMALDRIMLVEAVGRRDSDQYLRTVISNTAELMLVIDEDKRIRYASPALRTLIGEESLSPLATFTDLVHPDDRGPVRRAFSASGDGKLFCSLRRSDDSQILVEATYRDLREDRLVQGYVVTMQNVTAGHDPQEQHPHLDHVDELPAWVNRRSAQHKFRY
ncbi:PAS domain S-box protein [Actinoplanes sp. NPDC026619]|uniref:PAS domain S-box protein n=1 Tax=Actinoplanes sp. NPDC026619 TaxID=3155798 RepID=UPI00340DDA7C